MDIDLSQLDEHSESETLELKETFDKQALETISVFANTTGGTILIGVRDDGHVTGITLGRNTLEEWAQKMQSKIQPRILPSVTKLAYDKRTVVAIIVDRADSPVSVDGRYVKRVGRTNQLMSPEEIKQRLFASSGSSWDSQIVADATTKDLNEETVASFISLIKAAGRRPLGDEGLDEILSKLELVQDGHPTRAAILLLGKRPGKYFPSAFVQLGRFRSPTQIVDSKRLEGNIIEQIEQGMIWFQQRFETELVITGKPQRDEIWEYPLPAVREALTNAVCHREYAAAASTQVRLYDDRLEIWNPGALPIPLTPDRLLQKHPSVPRNRSIADSLFYAGLIESWGSGTLRIAQLAKETGLEIPEFSSSLGEFELVLRKRILTASTLEQMGLNQRQVAAVLYAFDAGRLTNREYQDRWSVSRATAARELVDLVGKGLLVRHGRTGKSTFYTVASSKASNVS